MAIFSKLGLIAVCAWLAMTSGPAFAASPAAIADLRPAAEDAARVLAETYQPARGQWRGVNWWQSANAVTALIDWMQATGSRRYLPLAAEVFEKNLSYELGDFKADSTDDTAWWALAWLRLYDLTHEPRYLAVARIDEAYIHSFWDPVCGGGVWWDVPQKTYKNAISNELYLSLTAGLHNRIAGDRLYLARARRAWAWLRRSGMINRDHLVNDGLSRQGGRCVNNGGATFTYNQGVVLGGLVELARAERDPRPLAAARRIAEAAMTSPLLSPGGIVTEPCEAADACAGDAESFKGIFVRNLGELDRALPGRPYQRYLQAQAASMIGHARNGAGAYGLRWAGPFDSTDAARQQDAVDLLSALL